MNLSDPWFEAQFYGDVTDTGTMRYLPSIEGAQGVFLWCPCGAGKPEYPLDGARPHGLLVPFSNPRGAPPAPPSHGPCTPGTGARPRWLMTGTGLSDLTITPSINVDPPKSCWHGFITKGEVR